MSRLGHPVAMVTQLLWSPSSYGHSYKMHLSQDQPLTIIFIKSVLTLSAGGATVLRGTLTEERLPHPDAPPAIAAGVWGALGIREPTTREYTGLQEGGTEVQELAIHKHISKATDKLETFKRRLLVVIVEFLREVSQD